MPTTPSYEARLATTPDERLEAFRLRYRVFVQELGGAGPGVDHQAGTESDRFDAQCDHLILIDHNRDKAVVGVYRLLRQDAAQQGFYSEGEYDLSALKSSGRRLLELGRSCVDKDYRGGSAMLHMWAALADYVHLHGIEILFGTASFHGTDIDRLKAPLSLLYHRHLAPENLRPRVLPGHGQPMDLIPEDQIDRPAAMLATPALIKAYLRLGGYVGDGAYVDRNFNTTDVCLVLDTARMNARQRAIYGRGGA